MEFQRWLIKQGKSDATAKKYSSVIFNNIKKWLPSYEIPNDLIEFMALKQQLDELEIYHERNIKGNNMYSSALKWYEEYLSNIDQSGMCFENLNQQVETKRLIKIRLAQNKFRKNVFDINQKCIVTGCELPQLLIASHIKPWAVSNPSEKIDGYNGLLLTPTYDKLFDQGLITFTENQALIYSSKLSKNVQVQLGLLSNINGILHEQHKTYLDYHHQYIFKS
ncbi:HNH endonuclease [Acinetobacter sp. HY1485]|uniref:HNH endonuclease n=1 Tax=Acinetobacter sp. HY1485 TaxID=2970918 RepID=UPI0022B99EBC|nr:HNH endonuclease [Acinetobacter sp. HY1485]